MREFYVWASIFLCILTLLNLYRAIYGPDTLTRIIAINAIGTKTVMILILIGLIYERLEMFIDIAIVYALLSFISTIIAAKFLERRKAVE